MKGKLYNFRIVTILMTTGFGYISDNGREGILATDRQVSVLEIGTKFPSDKLLINDDAGFAFAWAGLLDDGYKNLSENLMNGKIDVERVVSTGNFKELKNLNLKRWDGRLPDMKKATSLLFLTNFGDKRQLYTAWPLGKVEEKIATWIGSGSKQVEAYINSKDVTMYAETGVQLMGNKNIPAVQAREMVYNGLKLAVKHDMYSSGIDMAIMNEDGVRNVGLEFSELEKKFDKATLKVIMKK